MRCQDICFTRKITLVVTCGISQQVLFQKDIQKSDKVRVSGYAVQSRSGGTIEGGQRERRSHLGRRKRRARAAEDAGEYNYLSFRTCPHLLLTVTRLLLNMHFGM